ncbi:MAG: endonuclease/exonuclease/phosphatase family protein [Scytolyngbya sp. HA4215-MV1]|nr:endonuclease/exonuclease/phosphatase family protein [Scytolyngbya sp. HA4215-MV1]
MKVITINILFELEHWQQRRDLLVQGLAAEQADLIGIQEFNLQEDTARWLAQQLDMPYVYLVPYAALPYKLGPMYGAAILSRHAFVRQEQLDLQGQGRFAQRVEIRVDDRPFVFCNGHYYWQPGHSPARIAQIQLLLDWLAELPPHLPTIAVGDFNAPPNTPEIGMMRDRFISAYAAFHGQEPEYTCPTPLVKHRPSLARSIVWRLMNLWKNRTWKRWRGTIDYIFVSRHWQVCNCQLIFTKPAPDNPSIYPSDHFGLVAELQWVASADQ